MQHNKKREELHRLKEKYPEEAAKLERRAMREGLAAARRGAGPRAGPAEPEEDSSSSEEEEDLGLISDKKEAQILEVLQKIRAKDPAVFDPEAKFFSESDSDEEGAEPARKEKPMHLRDLIYKQAMEDGPEAVDSDEEAGAAEGAAADPTYASELRDTRKAFLEAVEEVEAAAEPDLKVVRRHQPAAGGTGGASASSAKVQELLDSVFGADEAAASDEADRFLKQFIMNRGWVEAAEEESEESEEEINYEEDEAYLERAEQYEHGYNFRFEEPGGAQITTHPRQIGDSVRREDDRRRKRRAERAERKAAEEEGRAAELRRLKNLKKDEVKARLREIEEVAGGGVAHDKLLAALGDEDFDPDEYDRRMAEAYGDDYYAEEEADPEAMEAEFERQLEALAYDEDDEGRYGAEGGRAEEDVRGDDENDNEEEEDEDDNSNNILEGERTKGRRGGAKGTTNSSSASASLAEQKATTFAELHRSLQAASAPDSSAETVQRAREDIKRLLDEYYKLDYEGVAGGIRTRFRYKDVDAQTFGLRSDEILGMEDKELNKVLGLRVIAAPYREDAAHLTPNYGALRRLRREHGEPQGRDQRRGNRNARRGHGRDAAQGQSKKRKAPDAPRWEHGPVVERTGPSGANAVPVKPRPQPTPEELRAATYAAPVLKRQRIRQERDAAREAYHAQKAADKEARKAKKVAERRVQRREEKKALRAARAAERAAPVAGAGGEGAPSKEATKTKKKKKKVADE